MHLAIATDWLTSFGGAERVLTELRNEFGNVPIYTSVYDRGRVPEAVREWDVRPSWLQRLPFSRRYSRALLPLMPGAFGRFDFSEYDAVISCSSAFSKAVHTTGRTRNVCYCFTPPRYLWDLQDEYLRGRIAELPMRAMVRRLQRVDLAVAKRA